MKTVAQASRLKLSQNHCIFIILLMAAVLRLPGLSGEWQYDEIWTLFNFTELGTFQILTDVALPNNHPVNTLLLKLLKNISGVPQIIRLGVFCTGIWVVFQAMKIAGIVSGENNCARYSAGILAGTAPALILFSVTARGYIFQLAGLMLCVEGLLEIAAGKRARYVGVKIVAGGVLSFLAVSSGIMFLGVIAAAYLTLAPKEYRWDKRVWIAGGILLAAALGYYLPLYKKLRTGQQWGSEVGSVAAWCNFAFVTLKAHLAPFTALLVLCGVIFIPAMRKMFLFALLPLGLAIVTKGGPERVYLVLTIVFIIVGACGFARLYERVNKRRKLLYGLFAAGAAVNALVIPTPWILPETAAGMTQVVKSNAEDVLPVIASTAGFPVMINEPEIAEIIDRRALFPGRLLMLECENGEFNGANAQNGEERMHFPVSGSCHAGKIPGYMYKLVPIDKVEPDTAVLVIFSGRVPEEFLQLPGKKLRLNLWLNRRNAVYIGSFSVGEMPYFEGVKYFQIGEK